MPINERRMQGASLLYVFAVTLAVMIVVSNVQLIDPMVRHDDFPALLADDSELFYTKTLTEGRWVTWLWVIRPFAGPAPVHYMLFLISWSLFSAAASIHALGRAVPPWYVHTLSILIAVAPPGLMISVWFNNTIPAHALAAIYAVLALYVSERTTRLLLIPFVPLTFMAYTSQPLLLLMVCLSRHESRRSFADLVTLMILFGASFALAIFVTYSLNYAAHGVFGVTLAPWRAPNPAHDLQTALANIPVVLQFLVQLAEEMSYESFPFLCFQLLILIAGIAALTRTDRWAGIYLATGIAAGIALMIPQILISGALTPTRAAIFLWLAYAIAVAQLALYALEHGSSLAGSLSRITMIVLIAVNAGKGAQHYWIFPEWQAETRKLAEQIPSGDGPVYILGDYLNVPGARRAVIQDPRALRLRLRYLTGEEFIICSETPSVCERAFSNGASPRTMHLPEKE